MKKRKTRIVATIGPASENPEVLRGMITEGLDVARLNFSHGTLSEHGRRIRLIRRLSRQMKAPVKILQDLAGYRIRIGRFRNGKGVELKKGRVLFLTHRPVLGAGQTVPFDYRGPLASIGAGTQIFLDDGNIELLVKSVEKDSLKAEVLTGGFLKERKGVNIPGFNVPVEGFTGKDRLDMDFGVEEGVDFIAQSFVRDTEDIEVIRKRLHTKSASIRLIAKIENAQGLCNVDRILAVSDGLMVARGDLGVSLPIHEIPMIQKMLIKKCKRKKKPVVTATQMLESMTDNARPTRAEVSDVANAILDGSNYVMLSGETAAGRYPVETVRMMRRIIEFTEKAGPTTAKDYCRYIPRNL